MFLKCLEAVWEYRGHVLASFWHPPGSILGLNFDGFLVDLGTPWERRGIEIQDFCGSRFPKGEFFRNRIFSGSLGDRKQGHTERCVLSNSGPP